MENNLKMSYLNKQRKGRKTYIGHTSKEDNLIIQESINMWKGNTYPNDDYGKEITINK